MRARLCVCLYVLQPVSTIVLCAGSDNAVVELKESVACCLGVLRRTLLQRVPTDAPRALAGAGCTEVHLSALLRHKASQLCSVSGGRVAGKAAGEDDTEAIERRRHLSRGLTRFADCLDDVVRALMGAVPGSASASSSAYPMRSSSTLSTYAALEELRECQRQTMSPSQSSPSSTPPKLYGWDPLSQRVQVVSPFVGTELPKTVEVGATCVLDAFDDRLNRLRASVEIANTILRIRRIVA